MTNDEALVLVHALENAAVREHRVWDDDPRPSDAWMRASRELVKARKALLDQLVPGGRP